MSERHATGRTLPAVQTAWAMFVGTLLVWWIRTDLYPDLIADGSLEGDWQILLGALCIGVLLAAPSVAMSRAVNAIEIVKDWRGRDVGGGGS